MCRQLSNSRDSPRGPSRDAMCRWKKLFLKRCAQNLRNEDTLLNCWSRSPLASAKGKRWKGTADEKSTSPGPIRAQTARRFRRDRARNNLRKRTACKRNMRRPRRLMPEEKELNRRDFLITGAAGLTALGGA